MNFYKHKSQLDSSGAHVVYAYDADQVESALEFRRICNAISSCSEDDLTLLEQQRDQLSAYEQVADIIENSVLMTDDEIFEHMNPAKTVEQLAIDARAKRDGLLAELDMIASNPLRWGDLTQAQKEDAATYRALLLDVPQQPDFPSSIQWPQKLDFMK